MANATTTKKAAGTRKPTSPVTITITVGDEELTYERTAKWMETAVATAATENADRFANEVEAEGKSRVEFGCERLVELLDNKIFNAALKRRRQSTAGDLQKELMGDLFPQK